MEQGKFNYELSQDLHNRIEFEQNACFSNAVKALNLLPDAEYVEGYAVSPKSTEPFLHAWLEFNGEIIDPSLPDGNHKYFPAERRSKAEYLEFVKQVEILKAQEPRTLPEDKRQNLPQHVVEQKLNPNYHNVLVGKMRLNTQLARNKPLQFEQAYREALPYKEG